MPQIAADMVQNEANQQAMSTMVNTEFLVDGGVKRKGLDNAKPKPLVGV